MSRRRKHDDSPSPKKTPHKTVAAEECGSVVEPGRRRLRSARGSWPCGAREGPPGPVRQREQPPTAALCSKSNPEGETSAARPALASAPHPHSPAYNREIWGGGGVWSVYCVSGIHPSRVQKYSHTTPRWASVPELEHYPVRFDHPLASATGIGYVVYLFAGGRLLSRLLLGSAAVAERGGRADRPANLSLCSEKLFLVKPCFPHAPPRPALEKSSYEKLKFVSKPGRCLTSL